MNVTPTEAPLARGLGAFRASSDKLAAFPRPGVSVLTPPLHSLGIDERGENALAVLPAPATPGLGVA